MQRWFVIVFKFAVTTLILALFIRQFDVVSVLETSSTISPYATLAAIVVLLAQALAAAGRLSMVVGRFGLHFGLQESYRLTLESMFFNQTFISFLGGDALKLWRIRRLGMTLTEATSAVVLDRVIGTLVNHIFLLVALPWFLSSDASNSVKMILVVLGVAGLVPFAVIPFLLYPRSRIGILDRLTAGLGAWSVTALILDVFNKLLVRPYRWTGVFVLSCFIAVANMVVFGVLLIGMGVSVPLAIGCALLVPAIMEIAMLPISLAGWGVREGAAIVAFGALGLPAEQALAASLGFGLILAAVSTLGGALWLVDRRKTEASSAKGTV